MPPYLLTVRLPYIVLGTDAGDAPDRVSEPDATHEKKPHVFYQVDSRDVADKLLESFHFANIDLAIAGDPAKSISALEKRFNVIEGTYQPILAVVDMADLEMGQRTAWQAAVELLERIAAVGDADPNVWADAGLPHDRRTVLLMQYHLQAKEWEPIERRSTLDTSMLCEAIRCAYALKDIYDIRYFYPNATTADEAQEMVAVLRAPLERILHSPAFVDFRAIYDKYGPEAPEARANIALLGSGLLICHPQIITGQDEARTVTNLREVLAKCTGSASGEVKRVIDRILELELHDCRMPAPADDSSYQEQRRHLQMLRAYWQPSRSLIQGQIDDPIGWQPHPLLALVLNMRERMRHCLQRLQDLPEGQGAQTAMEGLVDILVGGSPDDLSAVPEWTNGEVQKVELFIEQSRLALGTKSYPVTNAERVFLEFAHAQVEGYHKRVQEAWAKDLKRVAAMQAPKGKRAEAAKGATATPASAANQGPAAQADATGDMFQRLQQHGRMLHDYLEGRRPPSRLSPDGEGGKRWEIPSSAETEIFRDFQAWWKANPLRSAELQQLALDAGLSGAAINTLGGAKLERLHMVQWWKEEVRKALPADKRVPWDGATRLSLSDTIAQNLQDKLLHCVDSGLAWLLGMDWQFENLPTQHIPNLPEQEVRAQNLALCREYATMDMNDLLLLCHKWRGMAVDFVAAAKRTGHYHGHIVHDPDIDKVTKILATAIAAREIEGVSRLARCLRRPDDSHLHYALATLDELEARLRAEGVPTSPVPSPQAAGTPSPSVTPPAAKDQMAAPVDNEPAAPSRPTCAVLMKREKDRVVSLKKLACLLQRDRKTVHDWLDLPRVRTALPATAYLGQKRGFREGRKIPLHATLKALHESKLLD